MIKLVMPFNLLFNLKRQSLSFPHLWLKCQILLSHMGNLHLPVQTVVHRFLLARGEECVRCCFEGSGKRILQRSTAARLPPTRADIPKLRTGREVHRKSPGRARAAHGRKLLPEMPGTRTDVRVASSYGPERDHHSSSGPDRVWIADTSARTLVLYQPSS